MEGSIRSFIAVEIPEGIMVKIDSVLSDLSRLGADLRVVRKENLHFTLKFLGNIGPEMIQPIGECMGSVSHLLGFQTRICGFGAFPNSRKPRVLWIGAEAEGDRLVQLAKQLDESLHRLGFARERSYVPHLTLARSRTGRGKPSLMQYMERMREVDMGTMQVDTLVLKKSVLAPGGPIYSDILEVRPPGG